MTDSSCAVTISLKELQSARNDRRPGTELAGSRPWLARTERTAAPGASRPLW
jgi:hypothetical protein